MHLEISEVDRAVLERWQLSTKVPAAQALRGRAILLLADGCTITEIAADLRLSRRSIYKWLSRYMSRDAQWYQDRSRRPHRIQNRISIHVRQALVSAATALATKGQRPSAAILQTKLQEQGLHSPARTTVHQIIRDAREQGVLASLPPPIKLSTDEHEALHRLGKMDALSVEDPRRAVYDEIIRDLLQRSKRTREALQAARRRGTVPGNPNGADPHYAERTRATERA